MREKGRAKLTALGLRLLPQLTQAFDRIEAAFAQHREEDEGLLTVATTFTFANTWLAWRLGSFQVEHPDLAVRLATSNKLVDLKTGDADVAIRAGARPWEGLVSVELMKVDFSPMCAPSLLEADDRAARPAAGAEGPAQPAADQPRGLLVGPVVRGGRRGGRATGRARPASGSTARPTRAMPRWAGRASSC